MSSQHTEKTIIFGDPGRTAKLPQKPLEINALNRDTTGQFRQPKFNGLPNRSGHKHNRNSNFGKSIKPTHKRMSRAMGYCLTLDDTSGWYDFVRLCRANLNKNEQINLATAGLFVLTPDEREIVAAKVLGADGAPLPSFLGGMDDARFWASTATHNDLKAYALAAYEALPVKEQNAFRWHIGSAEVAV